jgi:phytoene dehydrogenase-like protein
MMIGGTGTDRGTKELKRMANEYDAVVVGSGPNGLAAAITLARAGQRVLILEGHSSAGGGMRTLALTEPGFHHDICSAVHPLGVASPFFRQLNLARYGLAWIQPPLPAAHPLDGQPAITLERNIERMAAAIGEFDAGQWQLLLASSVKAWPQLAPMLLAPWPLPKHPLALVRFGLGALWPAQLLAQSWFEGERARALFAGLAGHSMQPLNWPLTASFAMVLGVLAHAVGWPIPRGGSQAIADALVAYFKQLGGEIVLDHWVHRLEELPSAQIYMLDVTPRQLVEMAGDKLPVRYRRQLLAYRYGVGVCKVDYALSDPVPWRDPACAQAATVHLGGSLGEIAHAEALIWKGQHASHPFVLVCQPSLFDGSRAPAGQHTLWAYCHVPHGSFLDVSHAIEAQIERFAPGFRDCILAKCVHTATDMAAYNPNYLGGDINGGVQDWRQLWTRPSARINPYSTPVSNLYLCSSSTPPGGGVHGMAGYHAARSALARTA